ncbi:hypothetical protein [Nocardioides sp.]|uniref:hypothetical protein n=1 Tax=Nocardioides sp. TaxID=35761 RepID=UPI002611240B|nr:hypothetical protein [Nocardioides sp.]
MMNSRFARRAAAVAAAASGFTLLMTAPALAAVPEGWSNPEHVSAWSWLLVILILPIGAAIVITLIFFGPGFLKGKGFTGGQPKPVPGASSERRSAH